MQGCIDSTATNMVYVPAAKLNLGTTTIIFSSVNFFTTDASNDTFVQVDMRIK